MAKSSTTMEQIRVLGARENNLQNLSITIPKHALTVFVGVSGSGKSSLVFDTVAAESRRLINETYSSFVQGFMPPVSRPDVDALDGLTAAIIVGQDSVGRSPRSTVGTMTDLDSMMRILFSRAATPRLESPRAFSFNISPFLANAVTVDQGSGKVEEKTYDVAGGMCPKCEGLGQISDVDVDALFDRTKSLADGALKVPGYHVGSYGYRLYATSGLLDPDRPIETFSDQQRRDFLYSEPRKLKVGHYNVTYEGLVPRLQKGLFAKERSSMQPHIRAFVERTVTLVTCNMCEGTRLNESARAPRIDGLNIADLSAMEVNDLLTWIKEVDRPEVKPLLSTIEVALQGFIDIGLGYLSLSRATSTLSGGEAQRSKLIRYLSSPLTDITYVFDEPTAGLHASDVTKLIQMLRGLRDKGNTVLVIEHKPDVIRAADHIIELGPGAGVDGGRLCFEGSVGALASAGTLTSTVLHEGLSLKTRVRKPKGMLELRNARSHNLHDINVDLPLGVLAVITGVAGSGKSSLVEECLAVREDVTVIDQKPLRGGSRSFPATYCDIMTPIRKTFAKANNVSASLFSPNSEGACPTCNGTGVIFTDLGLTTSSGLTCDECDGKRFRDSVLDHTLAGHTISKVLDMPVDEAVTFFASGQAKVPKVVAVLNRLRDVGLGYLALGQPLSTLSGGERQRLKLASELTTKRRIYVLDEPTTGLHPTDVHVLLEMFDTLVDTGHSLIIVEHNEAVIAHADWIIDLGPGAGCDGGRIVFEGTPEALVKEKSTTTAKYLAAAIAKRTV
ncbi:ATP-binding cassette domain-containing protein [Actinomyces sp. Marseille-P3109]|uniref:ATP-binding cassette domain-containing protein n=1 Tax=Actinomyces sp. Marseille-P3109 TaxID=2083009 RepID=UPI000D55BA98|nr:excinuclease ABC subunit UvrA [Actinomyces sp. Marseille-P3109]